MLGLKLLINTGGCRCQMSSEALAKVFQTLPFARMIANGQYFIGE
jgi:hypothetical protein